MKFWDLRCEFDPFVKNSVYCGGCVCLFMESGVYVCVCVSVGAVKRGWSPHKGCQSFSLG